MHFCRRNLFAIALASAALTYITPGSAQTPTDPNSTAQLRPPLPTSPGAASSPPSVQSTPNTSPNQAAQQPTTSKQRPSPSYEQAKRELWKENKEKPYKTESAIQGFGITTSGTAVKGINGGVIKLTEKEKLIYEPNPEKNESITLAQPPLRALISVDENINPYHLEAENYQEISLRDALIAATQGNLDILGTLTAGQAQKWRLLNSYTKYIPNVTLGFNQIALDSISALPITAAARSTTVVSGMSETVNSTAQTTETIIRSPLTVLNAGFNWKPIQGGKLLFTALAERRRLKASKAQLNGDVSNTLLKCANDYYTLVLNNAQLQIRTRAVATSEEQVRQNMTLEQNGLATNLDVLQAKTQLARDRQELVTQQKQRRKAAVELSHTLNANMGVDLLPSEHTLKKIRLVAREAKINDLLSIAVDNRPELKQYEELRQAAKNMIMVAASDVLPSLSLGGNIIGIQSRIGPMEPTYLLNFGLNWTFNGLGTAALTDVKTTRWHARQAMIDANKQFLNVFQQVRNSYNECFTTESAIDETTTELASALEELRLARLRLDNGLGTNLDVLTAQRDLTQAFLDKAQAIINFNIAQVQLIHDIGLTSVDNLSSGRVVKGLTR